MTRSLSCRSRHAAFESDSSNSEPYHWAGDSAAAIVTLSAINAAWLSRELHPEMLCA